MNLIEMSLAASILIVGIVLFRFSFIHRIPKKVMGILWGIVVLRLVFPTTIPLPFPQVGFSLTLTQPEYVTTEVTVTTDLQQQEIEEYGTAEKMAFAVTVAEKMDLSKVLPVIYFLGVAIMFLGSAYLYVRDGRFFRESLPMGELERKYLILQMVPGEKERKYLEKVRFRISDRTATPVTYGVFKPAIVFPKGIFLKEEKEVGFCLLHELVHIRNHDNLRKLIVHAVLCIHWFNPFVWVMYILVNRDMELLCDELAVRKCRADRQDYALALLSLAERRTMGFRTALGFGKNAVKERILAVMSAGKTTIGGAAAAFLAVAFAVIIFLSSQMVVIFASAETSGEYTIIADNSDSSSLTYAFNEDSIDYANVAEYGTAEDDDVIVGLLLAGGAVQEQDVTFLVTKAVAETDMIEAVEMTEDDIVAVDEENWQLEVNTSLPDSLVNTLQELEREFKGMELQVLIGPDDYQLYYKEIPVYFFADNRNQDGEGFSGRVYAREAGNGNGNTGVATVRDENGVIIGLKSLSVEESKEIAKAWTGHN